MERYFCNGKKDFCEDSTGCTKCNHKNGDGGFWENDVKNVFAYYFGDYDFDRLRELAEADRDGRCVVLPVKVGESLWIHDRDGKPREMELDPPDIRCHCKEEDNLCMALCSAKNTGVCAKRLFNDGSDIGKTVFLTREAAEEALRRKQNGEEC